ncbi:MAG TPA: TraR/DksA family transcriptional regulator [Chloroflexota bacterium]|nr:TraR/DksA family transcriptional regulator [Chloroflexota bacterium]
MNQQTAPPTRASATKPRRGRALDLTAFRSVLEQERDRLLREAAALTADEQALSSAQQAEGGIAGDSADVASDVAEIALDRALEQTTRSRAADVEAALQRIDRGVYGMCEDCGHAIDPARLRALPSARRCLACQERMERRGRPQRS